MKNFFNSCQSVMTILATLLLCAVTNYAQLPSIVPGANNDPLTWKPFFPGITENLTITPAPDKPTTTTELAIVKEKIMLRDEEKMHDIVYWNAGAPSYRWNQIGSRLVTFEDFQTFSRTPTAWMNMAIYDATLAAWKIKDQNKRPRPSQLDPSLQAAVKLPASSSYPCEHSVTAAAAATVLAYFFPAKADSILQLARKASESRVYAGVQFPSDVKAGWALGEQVGKMIVEEAKKDGSDQMWNGEMNTDPAKWRGKYPVGFTMAKYKPLIMKSCDQFRPPAPPDFTNEMQELKACAQNPQTIYQAHYWAHHTGFDVWTDIAGQKMFEYDLEDNAPLCARIYALANVAMHDAGIAIMDAKYAYWGIRPDQLDPDFKPLIFTPPFPGYPSGHATASGTIAAVLAHFFPADARQFNQTAQECADSRFYGGIHFRTDNETGLVMGRKLGEYAVAELDRH
jgi:membrane-associated phospholipid phosphatase